MLDTNIKNYCTEVMEITLPKFVRVSEINIDELPLKKGIYAFAIDDENALPKLFKDELIKREHKLLYIGITDQSLRERILLDELNCRKSTSFFRSVGAMLGYTPLKGSLSYGRDDYKFSDKDQEKIIRWMHSHLLISYQDLTENLEDYEEYLILQLKPILNIQKNPDKIQALFEMRQKCIKIGWGKNDISFVKDDLLNSISSKTEIEKKNVSLIIEELMLIIKANVANGKEVTLRGFGTFTNVLRHKKNFHAAPGKIIVIPEHYEVVLRFSKEVKDAVK